MHKSQWVCVTERGRHTQRDVSGGGGKRRQRDLFVDYCVTWEQATHRFFTLNLIFIFFTKLQNKLQKQKGLRKRRRRRNEGAGAVSRTRGVSAEKTQRNSTQSLAKE